jgi:hypothetical protein
MPLFTTEKALDFLIDGLLDNIRRGTEIIFDSNEGHTGSETLPPHIRQALQHVLNPHHLQHIL